jgi:cytochrome c
MRAKIVPALFAALATASLASGAALADGDAEAGKKVFNKCKACHAVEEGKNKIGPSLFGVVGSAAGSVDGYKYSSSMAESGLTWDEETLDAFLKKPKDVVSGTKMTFAGLRKEDERDNVIAYLKTLQ